ncbi:phenylalanyl-tRNA synthetase [Ectocarpus siliculosus]|uniref:Phenylalanine--tRNA ligase alpha subunit n=1 Tax=Ectocarpus siliculosus TaxID=2880 RepID=D7FN85_ECTSI|nr:phenylalanyl-tRNA synthetase [Ectocarpus siliculosus]|eukprot:CBJ30142.1 phenylalanyl-tRNA synthetase [Ectocarpus siliculosus]
MTSAADSHRARRPPMALVATALLVAPGAAFTASTLPFQYRQPSSSRRLQQRAWEQSSRPVCGAPVLAAKGKGGKEGEAAAPAIDIETVSSELLMVQQEAEKEMKAATTLQELEDLRRKYMTKKGPVQKVMGQMRLLSPEDKPKLGKVSNVVKASLEETLKSSKDALENAAVEAEMEKDKVDVTLPGIQSGRHAPHGHRHPLSIMTELATDVFIDMGYSLVDGVEDAPEIENDYYCFEALNCPKDHPARDMQDTFYIEHEEGEEPLLLRTHTSSVQIRALERLKPPLAIVAPGRVYRRDTPDATHNPEFHQIEILNVRKSGELHLGHLKGTVDHFLKKMFGPDVKTRYRGSYFPFTEPSMEVDIWFKGKWMEVLGCGMVDPRVLEMAGVDPEEYSGFAAGFGVERFAMVLFGVQDLRNFWSSDMRFLEQFPADIQDMKDAVKSGSLGDPVA